LIFLFGAKLYQVKGNSWRINFLPELRTTEDGARFMIEDMKNYENAKKLDKKLKTRFDNQLPRKANLLPEFMMSDEELQNIIDAIGYAEYGVLNDSIIE
jgi:hypothetical protein